MTYLLEKAFSFSCEPVDEKADSGHPKHTSDDRKDSLVPNRVVFSLVDYLSSEIQVPGNQESHSDLERLNQKLDLVIYLINHATVQRRELFPVHKLRLSDDSIAWQDSRSFLQNQVLGFRIYLNEVINIPFECTVIVSGCQEGWYRATLTGLSDEEMNTWARWVFQQHRKSVSRQRTETIEC